MLLSYSLSLPFNQLLVISKDHLRHNFVTFIIWLCLKVVTRNRMFNTVTWVLSKTVIDNNYVELVSVLGLSKTCL